MEQEDWGNRLKKLERIWRAAAQGGIVAGTHCDLDKMACDDAAIRLGEHFGKNINAHSNARPKREQDKLAADLFQLTFRPINPKTQYPFVVLVDAPTLNTKLHSVNLNIKPNIIVDHHELTGDDQKNAPQEDENSWYWRAPYGACASMMGKLLLDFNVPFTTPYDETATLILLGIFSDTANLTSLYTHSLDREIVAELGKYADQETIHLISYSTLNKEFLRILHIATDEKNYEIRGNKMLVRLGEKPENSDEFVDTYMPKIANMFLNTKGVTMVYVWVWDRKNNKIIFKVRNSDKNHEEGWLSSNLKMIFQTNDAGAKHNAEGGTTIDPGIYGKTEKPEIFLESMQSTWTVVLLES